MKKDNITFPIGNSPIKESRIDSLRIKVTDKCQWQCAFCHNEGDVATADLGWGPDAQEVFQAMYDALPSIRTIHFTGGEPTRDPELAALTTGLDAMGYTVKTTTNGQFSPEILEKLIENGLKSYNFSVHSFNPERFLRFQLGRGIWWDEKGKKNSGNLTESAIKKAAMTKISWAKQQIARQKEMMLLAREKNVSVKLNTVISSMDDLENTNEIFKWAMKNKFPVRLLNDLGNGMESINAIREFIKQTGATEAFRSVIIGSSSCSTSYIMPNGYEFVFKQIRDHKLELMCKNCPRATDSTCEEQFYGIRLQKGADEKYYALLCIQEGGEDKQMPIADFLKSQQFSEISKLLSE